MAHAIIDRENRTITITKAFNAKASIYNSEEYKELATIQNAHPNFRLIIKAAKRKSIPLGRITYEQMEKYIKAHDDDKETRWNEYKKLRGISDDDTKDNKGDAKDNNGDVNEKNNDVKDEKDGVKDENDDFGVKITASFFEIKKWFVKTYPDITTKIETRKEEINKILNKEAI